MIKRMINKMIVPVLVNMVLSELYCKIHRVKLIHNKIIIYGENNTPLEIGYCPKCRKELCEFSDISPIYISNYEWLYGDD